MAEENEIYFEESENALTQTVIQNRYCFYCLPYFMIDDKTNYESCIKLIASFQTVEHFWRIYNHLVRPNEFKQRIEYHLFKSGIKPTWEDPQNKQGGKWSFQLKKGLASRYWEELILAIVGEQFDVGHEICGAVISIRTAWDVISVWNKNAENIEAKNKIRDQLRRILKLPSFINIEYKKHIDFLEYSKQKESAAAVGTTTTLKNPAWRSTKPSWQGEGSPRYSQDGQSPRAEGYNANSESETSPRVNPTNRTRPPGPWKNSPAGYHSPRTETQTGSGDPIRDRENQQKATEKDSIPAAWSKPHNRSENPTARWNPKGSDDEDQTNRQRSANNNSEQTESRKRFENPVVADKKKVVVANATVKSDTDTWTRGKPVPVVIEAEVEKTT